MSFKPVQLAGVPEHAPVAVPPVPYMNMRSAFVEMPFSHTVTVWVEDSGVCVVLIVNDQTPDDGVVVYIYCPLIDNRTLLVSLIDDNTVEPSVS